MIYRLKEEYIVNYDIEIRGNFIENEIVEVNIIKNNKIINTVKRIVKFSRYYGELFITLKNYNYFYSMFDL